MSDAAQIVVVGAGIVGLSCAYELRRRGARVQLVDPAFPGAGQSAGRTRIFRLAHTDPQLLELAERARRGWQRWEQELDAQLLDPCGLLLTTGAPGHEWLGSRILDGGGAHPLDPRHERPAAWDAAAGALQAARTLRRLQAGQPLTSARVREVCGDGVRLDDGRRLPAERVVVCAGPATRPLLGRPAGPRLRHLRLSFPLRQPAASLPCWINRDLGVGAAFYGLPDGDRHFALGLIEDWPSGEITPARQQRRQTRQLQALVTRSLPGLQPEPEAAVLCEYSAPREAGSEGWELLEEGPVLGLDGRNLFKFAPLLGELLALKALSG